MNTKIKIEDLSILQLADSFFPNGLYATSNGLEVLFYTKKLKLNEIAELIDVFLRQQVGPSDCIALGNAYESIRNSDLHGLILADQTLYSMRIIEAVRIASVRSGIQLLSNNAFTHITTQGATRIYKMENNFGTQMVNIVQEEGTYLEYIPDQIIPFSNSRFYQAVELNIHDKATMIYSEMLVPGRVASGESFKYDICYIKTTARNQLGKLRFIDIVKLQPKKENLRVEGIMGTFDILSTIYIITPPAYVQELQQEINSKIRGLQGTISGGASLLPDKQGVIGRLLGKVAEEVRNIIFEIITISRKQILGASFSGTRKP